MGILRQRCDNVNDETRLNESAIITIMYTLVLNTVVYTCKDYQYVHVDIIPAFKEIGA